MALGEILTGAGGEEVPHRVTGADMRGIHDEHSLNRVVER
jgi:hypothetical protein